jgi:hypothetical protein
MMLTFLSNVNWLAVIVCAVASMVIGFIWYGPLFSEPWEKITGWTKEKIAALQKNKMPMNYLMAYLLAFVIALVLAVALLATNSQGVGEGIVTAIVLWVGFTGATIGVNMVFERRPLTLFGIEAGYHLVTLVVYAIILSVWL